MKKFLLMLLGALTLSSAPSASAYTAADLIGKKCGVYIIGSNIQYDSERDHFACDVVAGSSSDQIILKDFLGSFDLPVTVNSNNTLTLQTASSFTGTKGKYNGYTITFGDRTPRQIYYNQGSVYAAYVDVDNDYTVYYAEHFNLSTGKNYTTETSVADSPYYDFMYEIGNGLNGFYFKYTKGSTTEYEALGGFKFCFFDAADKTTEYVNGVAVKSYDVDLELNGNNVTLTNLFNLGIMYGATVINSGQAIDIEHRAITGTIDYAKKTITLDPQEIGGGICSGIFGYKTYTAYSYNSYTGNFTNRGTHTGMWEVDYDITCDHHTLTSGTDENFAAVTGTFDYVPAHKNHNNNYWVSDGGTTLTNITMDINLGRAGYYSPYDVELGNSGIPYYADRINIKKENAEVTHAVDLVLNKVGVNDEYLYVNAEIVPGTDESRNQFVDHYELCVAPGNHNSISSFTTDKELGHINGTNLYNKHNSDWTPSTANRVAARAESTDALMLNKMVKLSDLKSQDANGKYTFYVKTVYKNNQIEPTFHSLAYVSNPTSIDDVEVEGSDVNITAGEGVIEISGAENVEVYTLSGAQVYAGGEGSVAVAKGIYVVKADGVVKKVTVK